MKYTQVIQNCLKERGIEQEDPRLQEWQQAFAQVKDPRRKQGQRFTLTSILLLALAAILSNHVSELAIAEWGAGQSDEVKKALGFEKGITPHQTTIQRLFRRLSVEELEAAFRRIFLQIFEQDQADRGARALAIDGKAHKGRLKCEEQESSPIHAVSIVDHQTGIVVTQGHVEKGDTAPKSEQSAEETKRKPTDQKTGKKGKRTGKKSAPKEEEKEVEQEEKKQRSELAVAYRLIAHIDWKGKILTGDALYCQRWLCAAILLAGGDYLFLVKANQPHLFEDLRLLFASPLLPNEQGKRSCAYQNNKGKAPTRDMDAWRSAVFAFLRNSKVTLIGLAWSKSSRSVVAGNIKGNGVRRCATASPVCLLQLASLSVCSNAREDIGRSKIACITSKT